MQQGLRLDDLAIGYRRRRRRHRTEKVVAHQLTGIAAPGSLTALVGPNGAGKSTLLRTICGLAPPLSGHMYLDSVDLTTIPATQLARTISVVLTDHADPGLLTVREIVAIGRTPHLGVSARMSQADHDAVNRALDLVSITDLASRLFTELSDGQRQRVLVARALAQEPTLMVLDEPTSFLDVPSRVELMDVLARLARDEGIAVLTSTHELELALRIADGIWLLSEGELRCGTPEELAQSGAIGTAFDRGRIRFDPERMAFDIAASDTDHCDSSASRKCDDR